MTRSTTLADHSKRPAPICAFKNVISPTICIPLAQPDQAAVQEACGIKIILCFHLVCCQAGHQRSSCFLVKPIDQVSAV